MAQDFKNKIFQKVLRGYAPEEVDDYIDYINEEHRKLERRCTDSDRKLALALKKLDEISRKMEELRRTDASTSISDRNKISSADRTAEKIIANAEKRAREIEENANAEASMIINRATNAAENIINQTNSDLSTAKLCEQNMRSSAVEIYEKICGFRDSLYELYSEHIETVESLAKKADAFMVGVDGINTQEYATNETSEEYDSEPSLEESYVDEREVSDESFGKTDDFESDEEITEETEELAAEQDLSISDYDISSADDLEEECTSVGAEDITDEYETAEADDEYSQDELKIDWHTKNAAEITEPVDFFDVSDGFKEIDDTISGYNSEFELDSGEEQNEKNDFGNLDDFFTDDKNTEEMSITDEFDIIFSIGNSNKNVDEIRRQPTVAAEETPKFQKHNKKHNKKKHR